MNDKSTDLAEMQRMQVRLEKERDELEEASKYMLVQIAAAQQDLKDSLKNYRLAKLYTFVGFVFFMSTLGYTLFDFLWTVWVEH